MTDGGTPPGTTPGAPSGTTPGVPTGSAQRVPTGATPGADLGRPATHLSRRWFLAGSGAAAGAVAAGLVGGGAVADLLGLSPSVRVAVPWSAGELRAFRAVLDAFPLGYAVELVSLGDDISVAFGPRTPRSPDVVMLPQPGLVTGHLDQLAELEVTRAWPYASVWDYPVCYQGQRRNLLRYGLPFKMANLSTVWYRKSVLDPYGGPPTTWSGWLDLNARLVDAGVAPLAVAAADGWTLAHTFQNVLRGCAPMTYEALARARGTWHEDGVMQAFTLLGQMWARPDALAGGVGASLVRQFPDAVVEVFAYRHAAMVIAPDFAESVVNRFAADLDDIGVFPFPVVDVPAAGAGGPVLRPVVVGGDLAVVPRRADGQAVIRVEGSDVADLVSRLAGRAAPRPWIEGYGGFIAANPDTPVSWYSEELKPLAGIAEPRQVAPRPAGPPAMPAVFGLSDQLGALGGRDGLWRVLQDFLVAVAGRPGRVSDAATDAVNRMQVLDQRTADSECR